MPLFISFFRDKPNDFLCKRQINKFVVVGNFGNVYSIETDVL